MTFDVSFMKTTLKRAQKLYKIMIEGKPEGARGRDLEKERSDCFRLTGSDDNYTDHRVFDLQDLMIITLITEPFQSDTVR